MRFFNTTGPVQQERHYAVPPLSRLNLDEVLGLIRTARYFVLHAPRQTGKTSILLALQNLLNGGAEGDYRALYINVEAGQAAREDTARAMRAILGELALRARLVLQDRQLDEAWPELLDRVGPDGALKELLVNWTLADPRPLVLEYARDLGLVAQKTPIRIANPLYAEVVPRELTWVVQEELAQETAWYVDADGGLLVDKLLAAFQAFFREHSEHWVARFSYREAGPQLLLQAFLQRVVNGGGRIEREYGLGRGRTDLLIVWPQGGRERRFVVECKLLHRNLEHTISQGLEQTAAYLDRCGGEAGHLVIFDRAEGRRWEDKLFHRHESAAGFAIEVWGM